MPRVPLQAQDRPASHPLPVRTTAAAASTGAAAAVIDTVIRPGRLDWTGYTTPGACLAAALGVTAVAERANEDTAPYAPTRDTLPSAAVATARACGARFTVPSVETRQLMKFLQLALVAGNDVQAQAIAERRVSLVSDPTQRARALQEVANAYLDARPMRLAAAEAVTARLDSMGQVAALPRNAIHWRLYGYASRSFDVPRAEHEAVARWSLYPRPEDDADARGIGTEALELFIMYLLTTPPADALTRVQQLLRRTNPELATQWEADLKGFPQLMSLYARVGQSVPPLTAKWWFSPRGEHADQHSWPVPGKVSVLMGGEGENARTNAIVRRLKQRYGDRLNVTYLMKTRGFFRNEGALTPEQEAERLRRYIQEDLQLPVTVAVEESSFQQFPDGRRIQGDAPSNRDDFYKYGFALVDPAGKLLLPLSYGGEATLNAFVDHALKSNSSR